MRGLQNPEPNLLQTALVLRPASVPYQSELGVVPPEAAELAAEEEVCRYV